MGEGGLQFGAAANGTWPSGVLYKESLEIFCASTDSHRTQFVRKTVFQQAGHSKFASLLPTLTLKAELASGTEGEGTC